MNAASAIDERILASGKLRPDKNNETDIKMMPKNAITKERWRHESISSCVTHGAGSPILEKIA